MMMELAGIFQFYGHQYQRTAICRFRQSHVMAKNQGNLLDLFKYLFEMDLTNFTCKKMYGLRNVDVTRLPSLQVASRVWRHCSSESQEIDFAARKGIPTRSDVHFGQCLVFKAH